MAHVGSQKKGGIVFDADDVLINSIEAFNAFHNNKYSTSFKVSDYIVFNFSEIWGINRWEIHDNERLFYKSNYHKSIRRMEGAYELIEILSTMYELYVVTGRGSDTEQYLLSTLVDLYEPHHFKSVHHVGVPHGITIQTPKWQKCKELNAQLLVDDYDLHLIKAAQNGIHGILMSAPWNKHITDLPKIVYRARNFYEALDIIEQKKELIFR